MIAVAFLPVFTGFGDANGGLIAAGLAARGTPGAILTDSPVAAYYSGKAPDQVFGSQSLPHGRADAIVWLRAHGVTSLVVEDISYYTAASVFPDLARGSASAPFTPLGVERSFEVAGGKPVHAFRLPPTFSMGTTRAGKTAPLAKGMTLGPGATGEGMGFGVPIARYADGWVYPRSASTVTVSSSVWRRTFELDEVGGDALHRYAFTPTASRGEVEVTYTVDQAGASIAVHVVRLDPGYEQVGLLNEASAAFDDLAADGMANATGAAFGRWVPVGGSWARLRSGALGVEWSVPSLAGASLFAGREHAPPDFDWSGLDYMFPAPFGGATYRIQLQEARS